MLPTLIGITLMVFSIMALAPGGVGASLLTRGGDMRPEERAAMEAYVNERYGLDKPLPHQYLRWLNNVSPLGFEKIDEGKERFGFKVPDLGMSFAKNRSVTELISEALPITLLLNLLSVPFIYTFSIIMGVYSARYRGSLLARVALGTDVDKVATLGRVDLLVLGREEHRSHTNQLLILRQGSRGQSSGHEGEGGRRGCERFWVKLIVWSARTWRFFLVTTFLARKRSMRLWVRKSVSGMSLNFRCTSTSQSIRMARILSLMSVWMPM